MQQATKNQEIKLLLERFRAAIKRGGKSEAHVLAVRYQALAHPPRSSAPLS